MSINNFVCYRKAKTHKFISSPMLCGLKSEREGYIYKYIEKNVFEKKDSKIKKGYNKVQLEKDFITEYYYNPSLKQLTKDNDEYKIIKNKYKGYKKYKIHDNGGRPFLVYMNKKNVSIYTNPDKKYYVLWDDNAKEWTYIDHIASYKPLKIWVGKSPETSVTKFSGGYGKEFDGNSILLKIKKDKYVYIGSEIYEFSTTEDINEYISPVGNNDVPYPVAIGKENIYFMLDRVYVPIKKFNTDNVSLKTIKKEAYMYFYGHSGEEALNNYSKNMKKVKTIKKRKI